MDGAGEIVGVSIPFTAGVFLSAFCFRQPAMPYLDAAFLAAVCLAVLIIVRNEECERSAVTALYLLIGIFCFKTWQLTGDNPANSGVKHTEIICSAIERAGFEGGGTAPLLEALLAGERGALPRAAAAAFRASGASHILALSGLHLGIVYLTVSRVLLFLGNSRVGFTLRSILCIIFCLLYVLVTGAGPSVTRAFIFICLHEISRHCPGRKSSPAGVFCTSLLIQLAISPGSITSISFQLSYLAMLGITLIFPALDSFYPASFKLDPVRKIWTSVAMSLSCQVFTAPLVWMKFHSFPLHFLLTNLIAIPITEGLVTTAFITILLTGIGFQPEMLVSLTDRLATLLQDCLEIISKM